MESIKDKVAIIGAGCTKFGENWEKSYEDMVIDATQEALRDAGPEIKDIDAFWAATQDTTMFASSITNPLKINYNYTHFETDYRFAQMLCDEAGIKNPRKEIGSMNLHDCFTIAEAVSLEDFGISPRGKVKEDIDAGVFSMDGELPINADGGLKCFGHPVGATGLRQMYEQYKQLQGKAQRPQRQLKNPELMMIHARGGWPGHTIPVGAILGR